jgi:hypothetical protein
MIGGIHIQTHRLMDGFMKCTVEMDSGAMIYTKFHKDWLRHSKINRGFIDSMEIA